jgi:hypothetical protein
MSAYETDFLLPVSPNFSIGIGNVVLLNVLLVVVLRLGFMLHAQSVLLR